MVSRDIVIIEGKPVNKTPAIYEELRTVHESITVLLGPPEESKQQLPTPPATEHADSDSDSEEPEPVDPQILLQESTVNEPKESTGGSTRASKRSNKSILTPTKFQDESARQR